MSKSAFVLIVEDDRAHGEAITEALSRGPFARNVVGGGASVIDVSR